MLDNLVFGLVLASPRDLILHVDFIPVSLMQVPIRGPMVLATELSLVTA